jgi:hypothetical protein
MRKYPVLSSNPWCGIRINNRILVFKKAETIMKKSEIGRALVFNMKRAEIAYKNYLDNDRQFLYAWNIKKANDQIIDIIVTYNQALPAGLEGDMLQLLEHLEIWAALWEDLEQTLHPGLTDEFVFENKHRFPGKAARNIRNHFADGK